MEDGIYLVSRDELKGKVILVVPVEIPVPKHCPSMPFIRGTIVTIKEAKFERMKQEYKNKNLDIQDYILYKYKC